MQWDNKYQTLVLAALLHNIGEFIQRGTFGSLNVEGRHPEVSARFVPAFNHFGKNVILERGLKPPRASAMMRLCSLPK